MAFLYPCIHSLTQPLIGAYTVPSPVREKEDTEMPTRQPLCLGSLQATSRKACQETHLTQSVPGHEILGWGVEGHEREGQRRGSREGEGQVQNQSEGGTRCSSNYTRFRKSSGMRG